MTSDVFFRELKKIILAQPKLASLIVNSENCENGSYVYSSKNLFNCFDVAKSVDSLYLYDSAMCAKCVDCDYAVESELCYECVDIYKSFNCDYLENCSRIRDSFFSYNCHGCHDIFGCVDLNNKSFCIFNRQLTENEYKEKVKKLRLAPPEKILVEVKKLEKLYPWSETNEANNEDTKYGNYIFYNKNCYLCFDAARNEDCAYLYDSFYNKFCLDGTYAAIDNELCYETVDGANLFNCDYTVCSSHCQDSSYIFNCIDVKNSLGCVSLAHKQYCILNRQLTKEEFESKSKEIIEELKNKNQCWADLVF
ncbi:MAG: hypothetical protein M1365_02005 [Actinobacteria bacterium]|nr:hypothetical protein [Actinomycetota bacterium]